MPTTLAPPRQAAVPSAAEHDVAGHRVPSSGQWMSTTDGRIAPSGEAWLEAVYWFYKYGPYSAGRAHGPKKFGGTTLRMAKAIAHLTECRPSIGNLVEWLKLSERTVKYHLAMLRESGLLTYRSKGTRVAGSGGRASEFERTIPQVFDDAAGLRTGPSDKLIRAVHGFSPEKIPLLKELHAAARPPRRKKRTKGANRRAVKATSGTSSCTPMVVSTSSSSTAGDLNSPSESKLASGQHKSPSPKKPTRRTLNATGRRYQLAAELIQQVSWLGRAAVPRIAWIVRHVADAGWSTAEVIAVVGLEAPARRVHRPSGFLANRLKGAHLLYDTPAKRAAIVDHWRDSRHAEHDRHAEWWEGDCRRPASRAVAREVDAAFAQLQRPSAPAQEDRELAVGDDGLVDLEQLTRDEVIELRAAALKDPALVRATVHACGETYARRLFTSALVDQVQRLTRLGRTVVHSWRQA
ncbi:helix-turn-helix domain-containing protein [Streptomyces sp. NBC_01142]|uniref:helix-turn-helix domain-containing protein n=1 Tax=Streptomyces sp. NBC_01142 TaxID=2975865 RepID=UPI00224D6A76|nr:helix-turn-helix domain-containing protein [Streptomyces sp. NBC_01142]MCX4826682.1 helix-turn-helix domain-containing protein [Streptomyces sp. NBC_01142]